MSIENAMSDFDQHTYMKIGNSRVLINIYKTLPYGIVSKSSEIFGTEISFLAIIKMFPFHIV